MSVLPPDVAVAVRPLPPGSMLLVGNFTGLGMPVLTAEGRPPTPLACVPLHDVGKQIISGGVASADAALAVALLMAKTKAATALERVHAAALHWDCERTVTDAIARRVAEAKHYVLVDAGQ